MRMSKPFFEVFPDLKLPDETKIQFDDVSVERVASNKQRNFLRIYINAEHLIPKEYVFRAEQEIKKQLFKNHDITIKIYENFILSAQYNLRNLLEAYKDSILCELKDYDHIIYLAYKTADEEIAGENEYHLTIRDTVLNRSRAEELSRVLEKILTERCHLDAKLPIYIHYK